VVSRGRVYRCVFTCWLFVKLACGGKKQSGSGPLTVPVIDFQYMRGGVCGDKGRVCCCCWGRATHIGGLCGPGRDVCRQWWQSMEAAKTEARQGRASSCILSVSCGRVSNWAAVARACVSDERGTQAEGGSSRATLCRTTPNTAALSPKAPTAAAMPCHAVLCCAVPCCVMFCAAASGRRPHWRHFGHHSNLTCPLRRPPPTCNSYFTHTM
jgi:hypothetical protein